MPRVSLFAQDEWTPVSGLRVLVGARWDIERPPVDEVTLNERWLLLTGIRADTNLTRKGRISPRVEIEWQPDAAGKWALRAGAGVWSNGYDPAIVGEVLANDGVVNVRRGFTTLGNTTGTDGATSLSLVTLGYQGPRSNRVTAQISNTPIPGVEVSLGGTYRRTELLPRRTDLNRVPTAVTTDQDGRPLFGELQQSGSLLGAATESNRRFSDFDVVSAIGIDGWSDYKAIEGAIDAQISNRLSLQARYTYSQTEDNWFQARRGVTASSISPFDDTDNDWTEGVSDFDVPMRAMLGAELALPFPGDLHIAGLFRLRSGHTFTPGYRTGVDANADGAFGNDPAFLTDDVSGFNTLSGAWPCLREQLNSFAARNSCRTEDVKSLSLRVSWGWSNASGRRADLILDALNVIGSGGDEVDEALYLVDANRQLQRATDGSVIVPLLTNPNFGKPLLSTRRDRALRVGVRVTY